MNNTQNNTISASVQHARPPLLPHVEYSSTTFVSSSHLDCMVPSAYNLSVIASAYEPISETYEMTLRTLPV